ncbi:hypothetical protein SBADM41S_08579 [Streptomyces badius]
MTYPLIPLDDRQVDRRPAARTEYTVPDDEYGVLSFIPAHYAEPMTNDGTTAGAASKADGPATGSGDIARSLELLWGTGERSGRGPKPGLSLDRIVTAAVAVADAEGLTAVSMRLVRAGHGHDVALPVRPRQGRVARPDARPGTGGAVRRPPRRAARRLARGDRPDGPGAPGEPAPPPLAAQDEPGPYGARPQRPARTGARAHGPARHGPAGPGADRRDHRGEQLRGGPRPHPGRRGGGGGADRAERRGVLGQPASLPGAGHAQRRVPGDGGHGGGHLQLRLRPVRVRAATADRRFRRAGPGSGRRPEHDRTACRAPMDIWTPAGSSLLSSSSTPSC